MPKNHIKTTSQATVAIILWTIFLGGCTASVQPKVKSGDEALVKEAVAQREMAYARLTKAIGSYCSIRYESLEAKQRCVLNKQMDLLKLNRNTNERGPDQIVMNRAAPDSSKAGRILKCEGTALRVTCHRVQPAFAELLMNGP
jgi:hypothetical protein